MSNLQNPSKEELVTRVQALQSIQDSVDELERGKDKSLAGRLRKAYIDRVTFALDEESLHLAYIEEEKVIIDSLLRDQPNSHVLRAVQGETSVAEALRRLGRVNEGFGRYGPRKAKEGHNDLVAEMEEITGARLFGLIVIPTTNIVSHSIFTGGATLAHSIAAIAKPEVIPVLLLTGAISVYLTSKLCNYVRQEGKSLPYEAACFTDARISELQNKGYLQGLDKI